MGDITTSAGTHISIGGVAIGSSVDTLAEFQATSTWTELGLVESIAPFGDKSSTVTFAAINDARMRKQKGIRDAGDCDVVVGFDDTDPGQLAFNAAEETDSAYPFKVALPNGTIKYFRAFVMSQPLNVGGNDNVVKVTYTLAIDSAIFTE